MASSTSVIKPGISAYKIAFEEKFKKKKGIQTRGKVYAL
jgi:hypothetical protein